MVLYNMYNGYILTVTVKILSLSESSVKLYEFTVSYQICTCLSSLLCRTVLCAFCPTIFALSISIIDSLSIFLSITLCVSVVSKLTDR